MGITEVVAALHAQDGEVRTRVHWGAPTPVPLAVVVRLRVAAAELEPASVSGDLDWLWRHVSEMRLFEDVTYGQWGFVLFSERESAARTLRESRERPGEYWTGDRIVGEFLGDSELLGVRADQGARDCGAVFVAEPLYDRSRWPVVSPSLADFLRAWSDAEGAKFWTAQG
jgi:hypothetical protein